MTGVMIKKFGSPDETRKLVGHGKVDIFKFGESTVGRTEFEPGWKWSNDVKPLVGTESCQDEHTGYVLSGRMHVKMDDGQEAEFGAGDLAYIPAGHDNWVVGGEKFIALDFSGMATYGQARTGYGKEVGKESRVSH